MHINNNYGMPYVFFTAAEYPVFARMQLRVIGESLTREGYSKQDAMFMLPASFLPDMPAAHAALLALPRMQLRTYFRCMPLPVTNDGIRLANAILEQSIDDASS